LEKLAAEPGGIDVRGLGYPAPHEFPSILRMFDGVVGEKAFIVLLKESGGDERLG